MVQYTKKGKSCIVPAISGDVVLLPNASLRWAASLSDKVLSAHEAFVITDSGQYAAPFLETLTNPWQGSMVRTDLNRAILNVTAVFNDEVDVAFARLFGIDTHAWTELVLYDAMKMIVAQASSRYTVGLPLCTSRAPLALQCLTLDQVEMRHILATPLP